MTVDLGAVVETMGRRIYTLEQRITSPEYVVPNGSSPTFQQVKIGVPGQPPQAVLSFETEPVTDIITTPTTSGNDVRIQVGWTPSADSVQYEVQWWLRDLNADNFTLVNSARTNGTSYVISQGLLPGRIYGIRVYGVSSLGAMSEPTPATDYARVTTLADGTIPVAITNLDVTPGYNSLVAMWDISTDPDVRIGGRYRVQVSTASDFSTTLYDIQITATIASFADLTPTPHYVRVAAIDASSNQGPWTTHAAVTPGTPAASGDNTPPSSSPVPSVTPGVGFFFVRWSPVGGTTDTIEYDVYISTDPTVPTTTTANRAAVTAGTVASIRTNGAGANLAYDTNYYFRVIARDVDGSAAASAVAGPFQLARATGADVRLGSVTAASGIISSLDAGVITFGQMHGDRIEAKTITTERLTVTATRPNAVRNGGFEETSAASNMNAAGWTGSFEGGGTPPPVYTEASGPEGSGTRQVGIGPGSLQSGNSFVSDYFPCGADTKWWGQVRARATNGNVGIYVRFMWYANEADAIAAKTPDQGQAYTDTINNFQADTTMRTIEGIVVTAPANTKFCRVAIYSWWPSVAGHYTVIDDVQINQSVPGTMITPNSITTDLIAAAGISAGHIKFGTMNGDRIAADTLDVNAIKTSTLTSATITLGSGGVIKSAGTSTYFTLTESAFILYKNGSPMVTLNGSTGDASFKGDLTGATGNFSGNIVGGGLYTGTAASGRIEILPGAPSRILFRPTSVSTDHSAAEISYTTDTTYNETYLRIRGGARSTTDSVVPYMDFHDRGVAIGTAPYGTNYSYSPSTTNTTWTGSLIRSYSGGEHHYFSTNDNFIWYANPDPNVPESIAWMGYANVTGGKLFIDGHTSTVGVAMFAYTGAMCFMDNGLSLWRNVWCNTVTEYSDPTRKNNIEQVQPSTALEDIMAIEVIEYDNENDRVSDPTERRMMKDNGRKFLRRGRSRGVNSHTLPEANKVVAWDGSVMHTPSATLATAIGGIKQLVAEKERLESTIAELSQRIAALEAA